MHYIVVCTVALLASGLTLFSGFGLGTLLLPAFAIFFPVDIAIVLTAIVHFLNNIFKLVLLGRQADKNTVIRFGLPSIIAALLGAWLLTRLTHLQPLYSYTFSGSTYAVTPVKLIIALVIFIFSLLELMPAFSRLQFPKKWLPLGGMISGFFGGLSGNQGAMRTAFLIKAGLQKESFIATGVVLACIIDITRLAVYTPTVANASARLDIPLIAAATLAAFTGAFIGSRLLKKITISVLHIFVGVMLLVFSILLALGIL